MMNSIRTRLIALYAAVMLIVVIVSGTVMLWYMRQMEIARTEQQLRDRATTINEFIVQQYDRVDFNLTDAWATFGVDDRGYGIQGVIMTDFGVPIAPMAFIDLRITNMAVQYAINGEEGFSVGRPGPDIAGRDHSQWISFAMPVTRGDETFIVYTRTTTDFMNEILAGTAFILGMMVLISLVLTLVLCFFLANMLTRPIISLTRHAKALAAGDFSRRIEPKSNDEIGQLMRNFNHMAQELSSSLSSMSSETNKREAILQNTSHGVLAYGADGNLTHANNASIELLPAADLQSYNLEQVLEFLGIDPQEVYNLKTEEVRESTYQDCDYFILACVTSYSSQADVIDGYIIVLQDISRQMKLDNMRKEFVANVSHELRTPLTTIRTYTETLIDGAVEDIETTMHFLKIVEEEASRMTLLVSDLLELSRLDSKQATLEMDVVDLVALLRLTVRQSQFLADTKNQTIEMDVSPNPCFIEANASRINQVITNILSNAIKYSPENTEIKVVMEATDKYYRIFIKDRGMGIPQEDIAHIFERFYRVDKARARAMGGTGLGLAIVKEIMEEHGGAVHVSSQMGQGTTMTLRFNKYQDQDQALG